MPMPLQDSPRNASELQARMNQRDELANQLRSLTQQRGHLGQERLNAMARQQAGAPSEARLIAELDQRIRELGQREREIESQKLSADDAISDALARGVGVESPARTVQGTSVMAPTQDVSSIHAMYQRMMGVEAAAFILLGVIAWRLLVRGVERRFARSSATSDQRMEKLQQTVDSIAIEVERVSENQRFVTRLLNERLQPGLGSGAAQPIELAEKAPAPVRDRA